MMKYLTPIWNSAWMLSIAAGILLGLSFPPIPFPFLTIPAFILVFRLIEISSSAREAAYHIYPGFVIWNLIATYWLMMASLVAGIAAILANAAVMTVPVIFQKKVQVRLKSGWIIALLQAALWISFEFLHHHWDLAWPWLSLGNAWANVPSLVQYISVTGYLGISFWLVFSAALAYQAITKANRAYGYSFISVLLLFPALSVIQGTGSGYEAESYIETAVVQPNFDSYQQYGGYSSPMSALTHMLELTDSVRTDSTTLVIWPENGIHPSLSNKSFPGTFSNRVKEILHGKAEQWNGTLIGGATYFEYYAPETAPALPMGPADEPYLAFNAALAFYPDSTYKIYRKHNLVPIVERMPFVHFLNAIDVFSLVNWNENQNYGKGYELDQFRVNGTSTPALVCYDSVFPSWVRGFVRNGAGLITVITNDGWWGKTSGHIQHFDFARLRAIEFRRWVVRSANNGISGVIAPDGSIKKETEYWTKASFRYRVPVISKLTLYARFGDWFPKICLILSFAGILYLGFPRPSVRTN